MENENNCMIHGLLVSFNIWQCALKQEVKSIENYQELGSQS